MDRKKISIIGAGPGGLAAAMLLAKKGFAVEIFEKREQPGGRTSEINLQGFRFDVGPTFYMMKFVLDEIFEHCGKNSADYLDFIRLDPMYDLILPDDRKVTVYEDKEKMRAELEKVFPQTGAGLDLFYQRESRRFKALMPILQADNQNPLDALRWRFIKALPYFSLGRSVFDEMGRYFPPEFARLVFTFQSKYLGMSPWQCPGAFGLVPFVEHEYGVYHVKGGLSEISRQMARAAEELGVKIHYQTPVKKILFNNKIATGLESADRQINSDAVITNADFGYAMDKLADYPKEKLKRQKLSCSIFMWYVGLNKQYKLPHNTIVFAKNYRQNVQDIFGGQLTDQDISFYVRDHTQCDPSLAPAGKTALYVLVPVPNCRAQIKWTKAQQQKMRAVIISGLKQRLGLNDIEDQIAVEQINTPETWQNEYNVYQGAVFNLGHNLSQMLWFRPHNRFDYYQNLYLVGGGTHPGSGLPTIYESGRITAKLICKKYGIKF